jgi:NAD(P)-dependent dehydrogenase (short-subunit alcohol dehydrogenase family)
LEEWIAKRHRENNRIIGVRMDRKIAVITGATSGIGYQTALTLLENGFEVIGIGRDPARCRCAEEKIRGHLPKAAVKYFIADLSRQSQVRAAAGDIKEYLAVRGIPTLDVLVNNAGTFADRYTPTEDGVEMTLAVNHIAPFLLTHELLPLIMAAPSGRVITVSSESHHNTWMDFNYLQRPLIYVSLWAYKVSKLANVLFSAEFNRRMTGVPVRAYAVDPGLVNTDIGLKGTSGFSQMIWKMRQRSGTGAELPAATIAHLCNGLLEDKEALYWRNSRPGKASRQALNPNTASRLWEMSSQLCALEWERK